MSKMTPEKQALIEAAELDVEQAETALYASGPWLTYENAVHNLNQLRGKPKRELKAKDALANVPADVTLTEPKTRKPREKATDVDGISFDEIDANVSKSIPSTEADALTIGKLADKTGLDTKVLVKSLKRLGAKSIGNKRGTKYYIEVETATEEPAPEPAY